MAEDYSTTFFKASGDHVTVPGQRAEKLYESLRHEMYDGIFNARDSVMLGIMQGAATPEDLKVADKMFADRKGMSVEGHLNQDKNVSNDASRDKALAMLYHEDGPQNAAGEIRTIIGEIEKGGGASRSDAESRLRQLLGGMSARDI